MNRTSYILLAVCFLFAVIAIIGWSRRPSVDPKLIEAQIQKRIESINERHKNDRDYLLDRINRFQKDLAERNKKISEYDRQIRTLTAKEIKPPVGALETRQRWKDAGYETH
jgi:uncharacterized protein YoxC